MNIAIIGYGKMGKEIELLAKKYYYTIAEIIDKDNWEKIQNLHEKSVDIAFEFTTPDAAPDNLMQCIIQKIPVVCGTTGWYHKQTEIEKLCKQYQSKIFIASNFSIGVNLYFETIRFLTDRLNKINTLIPYQLSIEETHHIQKKDSPSGTAINMATIILNRHTFYKEWKNYLNEEHSSVEPSVLPIYSYRKEDVIGIHKLILNSEVDTIEFNHSAKSRKAFAIGAILAGEFLIKQPSGIYTMQNLLNF